MDTGRLVCGNGRVNNRSNEAVYHRPSSFPSKCLRLNEKPVYRITYKRDMTVLLLLVLYSTFMYNSTVMGCQQRFNNNEFKTY